MTTKLQDSTSKTVGEDPILIKLLGNRDLSSLSQFYCMYFIDFEIRLLWLGTIFFHTEKRFLVAAILLYMKQQKNENRSRTPPSGPLLKII